MLDNDEPWKLEPWQCKFVKDLFAGFKVNWLVVPEGNGKTTLTAGLALYHIAHRPSGFVAVAAAAKEQADWLYRQAEGFVFRSDLWDQFECLEGFKRIRCDDMGSRIQIFAADDRTGDGAIATLYLLDELHRQRSLALYRTWFGKIKKRDAQMLVISTAGEVASEFEQQRSKLKAAATSVETNETRTFTRAERLFEGKPMSVIHEYAVPDDGDLHDLEVVAEANPFSAITVSHLREKREYIDNEEHWGRFTCNRAMRSASSAISEAQWTAAGCGEPIPKGVHIYAGLDLGFIEDATALVPLWVKSPEHRQLGKATVLVPPNDRSGLNPREIENAILELHARNPIDVMVMDPTHAEQMAVWIAEEIGCAVVKRGQTRPFQVMDYARFTEALREGWLRHSNDQVLSQHVLNAIGKVLPGGDIIFARPVESRNVADQSRKAARRIDALMAACFAHTTVCGELAAPAAVGWAAV